MSNHFFDKRLLREAAPVRLGLTGTVVLGLLGGVLTVCQAYYLSLTVASVFLAGGTLTTVRPLLILLLCASLGRAAMVGGSEMAAGWVAGQVKTRLRMRLADHLLTLGPAYVRGERTGELVNTMVEGIEALEPYFSQYLPQVALAALIPLTVLAFITPLDLVSGLALLLTAPLIPIFMILIGNLTDSVTRRQWTALSRMSAHFLDALQGLTTLKLFNRSREQIRLIAEISDRFSKTTMEVLRVTFLSALTLELVATISTAVVAVQVGLRLLYGHSSFEQAFFVLILAPEFYGPLRMLGARFHAGMAGVAAARRIFEVLQTPMTDGRDPELPGTQSSNAPSTPQDGGHESRPVDAPVAIRFDNVSYTYPGNSQPVLDGISLEIPAGQIVALVGSSGGGKSTIAQLLLRFIEPTSGKIVIGEEDPLKLPASVSQNRTWSPADWRSQVAWVPQLPYLFSNTTIADSIRLGRPEASLDEVKEAARLAHADEFIRKLPQGYDTVLDERGARLSGGQAQRIALARAFLKDAPVVILDEATANLDPGSEALLQGSMRRLLAGRTTLVIAHRLNTIRQADRIIVLDGGHVVETGTHHELMARQGMYQRLVNAWSGEPIDEATDGQGNASRVGRIEEEPNEDAGGKILPNDDRAIEPTKTSAPALRPASPFSTLQALLWFLVPFLPLVAISILLGVITIGSGIGLIATSAWLIASAALHPSISMLQVAIVGVRFFGLTRGLARYAERLVSHDVTLRVLARLRTRFYDALEPLAPAGLQRYHSGDLLSRIVADVSQLENFYVRAVAPSLVAAFVGLLMGIFLYSFAWHVALGFLAIYLLMGAGVPILSRFLSRRPSNRVVSARADLNAVLVDGIQGVADLVAFGCTKAHLAHVRSLNNTLVSHQLRLAAVSAITAALGNLLTNLGVLLMLILAIPLVHAGQITGVDLAVLALAVAASFEAVLPLPLAAQYGESCLAAAARILEIGDWRSKKTAPNLASDSPTLTISDGTPEAPYQAPALAMENLRFGYHSTDRPALDGVTISIPAGKLVAVIGPSGAGKSTLVNLLVRLWDYKEGSIRLDSREIRDMPAEQVRAMIGVVAQNTHLFNATVRDNLRLARPGATQEEIEQAARQAQIHEFVTSLPQGYETWIGEQGLRLSGGERQRLAIARVILRNAPVLILDEATANLDALTERAVLETLATAWTNRTTLMITHRLTGLERAHEIIVLYEGRVAERGRHAQLLAARGLYWRLWEAGAVGDD